MWPRQLQGCPSTGIRLSVVTRRYCINEHLPVRLTMMLGSDGDWSLQPLLTKCLA